jgi:hypothetical protein
MSLKHVIALLASAALVTPVFADVSDGRGGRTSPQASPGNAPPAPQACAAKAVAKPSTPVAASPAELKAVGEVASASRTKTAAVDTRACYKRLRVSAPVYASSAELKAVGHLGRNAAVAGAQCCESQACPMHRAS